MSFFSHGEFTVLNPLIFSFAGTTLSEIKVQMRYIYIPSIWYLYLYCSNMHLF